MIRVCLSAYIEAILLFESVAKSQLLKSWCKDGKRQRDFEDIISLFKEIDLDVILNLVARNLQKLPPVSYDHIDIQDNHATAEQLIELRTMWWKTRNKLYH